MGKLADEIIVSNDHDSQAKKIQQRERERPGSQGDPPGGSAQSWGAAPGPGWGRAFSGARGQHTWPEEPGRGLDFSHLGRRGLWGFVNRGLQPTVCSSKIPKALNQEVSSWLTSCRI